MKTKIDDPIHPAYLKGSNPFNGEPVIGLTKLEYFTAAALTGLANKWSPEDGMASTDIANIAVVMAKATIKELNSVK